MKRLTFILLCCTHFCVAGTVFTLTGTVDSPVRNYLVITLLRPLSGVVIHDTLTLQPGGRFSYRLATGTGFKFLHLVADSLREVNLQVSGNGSLRLAFREGAQRPQISGAQAKIQQFPVDDRKYWEKSYAGYLQRNPAFEQKSFLHSDLYFKIQDSISTDRIRHLKGYFGAHPGPVEKQFIASREKAFIYSDLFYKQSYPGAQWQKFEFYRQRYPENVQTPEGHYYLFSDRVSFNDPALAQLTEYARFMYSFLLSEVTARRELRHAAFSYTQLTSDGLALINELSSNEVARESIKAIFLANMADEFTSTKNTAAAAQVLAVMEKARLKIPGRAGTEISGRFNAVIRDNRFKKGSPAIDFEFLDTLGHVIRLADLKGKRIVIDVAASWCGPCIAGIPEWDRRVSSTTNPDEVFIFLSLDTTPEEWNNLRNRHPAKGLNLYAGAGGFNGKFAKDYEIHVLPNQIVIDKNGKFESYFSSAQ